MKIENLNNVNSIITTQNKNNVNTQNNKKEFEGIIQFKEPSQKGINISSTINKEYIQNFAEWYFKLGKSYENSKNYKQAISAYEKSYSVSPDISKAQTVDELKSKISKKI